MYVNIVELLWIRNGLQDLRQLGRCLNGIHGSGLKSSGRGVLKTKSVEERDDVIVPKPRPGIMKVGNAQRSRATSAILQ